MCAIIWANSFDQTFSVLKDALWILTIVSSILFGTLCMWITSTFSKKLKSREFLKHTLIWSAVSFVLRTIKKIFNHITAPISTFANKSIKTKVIIFGGLCYLYILMLAILSGAWIIFVMSLFVMPFLVAIGISFALKQMAEFEEIKKGTSEIRNGNLTYKIPVCKNNEVNFVADNINNIGEGLEKAVNKATSSEKMKTELITNVSHDLKTPLTSIISYVDLLSQEKNLSSEAKDYITVLKLKSERLKNIIADLFDLTKGTSGNAEIVIEKLDLKKLIEQTLADMDDEIIASGQTVKQKFPESEVYINADEKRLFKVTIFWLPFVYQNSTIQAYVLEDRYQI